MLLAEGHLLIEDVPGVGKTMLAKSLARSIDCTVRRIQFTPDLLPSDITGVSVFNQDPRDFEFRPGAIFANVVVGDEINRASPKTQSALLESMEERQVTVDGQTYQLHKPFIVMATQNPIEMEGTYPLPEAQRDRFMARISMGYPAPSAELAILDTHGGASPLATMTPVTDGETIARLIDIVRDVHASPAIRQYAVDISTATRSSSDLRLGASPRATLHLLRASRAVAAIEGRDHVLPDDVQSIVMPVLAHRLILSGEAQLARRSAAGRPRRPAAPRARGARSTADGASWLAFADVLTGRGRAFVASGVTLAAAGWGLGFPDISRFGVLLLVLPIVTGVSSRRQRASLRVERHSSPSRGRRRRARHRHRRHVQRRHPPHPAAPRGGAPQPRPRRPAPVPPRPAPAGRGPPSRVCGALAPARPAPARPAHGASCATRSA